MLSRSTVGRSASKAIQQTQRRGLAAAASGSFQYQTAEAAGVKLAARDLPGPVTTLTLVAKAGTRYEALPGFSSALEKFAYKSTTKRSTLRIQRETELLGGEISAYHTRENLVVRAKFLKEDLPYFTELLGEVATKTRYTRHELDEEVAALVKLQYKNNLASPLSLATNSVYGLAFHRGLGNPLEPTSSAPFTKYLNADAIAEFSKAVYSKSNVAVVANGASSSDLSKWVGQFFGDLSSGASSVPLSDVGATKYFGGEERIAHDGGNVTIIGFLGSSSFTSGSSFKPEVAVLAALLGGESSIKWSPGFSLLSKAAAEYSGATVSTKSNSFSDAGLLTVTISGNADHVAQASKNVVATLKKVANGEVASEDIKKAIAFAKFRALEEGQDLSAGLEATGNGLIANSKAFQIDEVGASIDKVSEAQVKEAANSLLSSRASISTVGDLFKLPYAEEIGLKL